MQQDANIATEKAALRARMISLRRSISEKSHHQMSMAITRYVMGLPEIVNADHIHIYLSMSSHAEVDTAAIIEGLIALNKQVSVPVIINHALFSAVYHKNDSIRSAQFGQPEPENVSIVDDSLLDVVLMPLLAFDNRGYRLGYGKGFYDAFLLRLSKQGISPTRIGLAFSRQMTAKVPADPWDEVLDGVVHENGILRFT